MDIVIHEVVKPLFLQFRLSVQKSAMLFLVAVADNLAHRVFDLSRRLIVPGFHVRFNVGELLHADFLHQFRQRVIAVSVEFLCLHDRLERFPTIGQIGRAHAVVPRELVRQLRRAHTALFTDACTLQGAVVSEYAAHDLPAQSGEPFFDGPHPVVVHRIFHRRRRRRVGIPAVDFVPGVNLRVNALPAEHHGNWAVLAVPLRSFYDRDTRHRQSAERKRAPQVLLCQAMHGDKIAHLLHRFAEGELRTISPVFAENGRKRHPFDVDFSSSVGYTTYITAAEKFHGRVDAHGSKNRSGSFFIRK